MKMIISNDIRYVGVNDHKIDLFEGQYTVPNGMAYNSYIVVDEKIAVFDTVDINFTDEWLNKIDNELKDKNPDYLIIQHMEPDHSASILAFCNKYPSVTIVGNTKTFKMLDQFFNNINSKRLVVNEYDKLSLGSHELTFIFAPMVHWPEVMVTYDNYDKVLFSADGFGKFGALDINEDWTCEARRYYFGIVGKYGLQVQALLKKLSNLDIKIICPLHGPMLNENLGYYLDLYDKWSSYTPEDYGIAIMYTSVYGNTKKSVYELERLLKEKGYNKIEITDLARCDMSEAIESAFRYSKLVLATTTYNNDIFPYMREFIENLLERNYQNRTIGLIENGSWAPIVIKKINSLFEKSKNINIIDKTVKIMSSLNNKNYQELEMLAEELIK